MDYLSILPTDLKNLLQHYINYDSWAIVAEIYEKFLFFYRTSGVEPVYEAFLSKLKLKYLMKDTINNDAIFSDIDFHCRTPILDASQLITPKTVKTVLKEFAANPKEFQTMYYGVNKILKTHNCPLEIIELRITKIKCFNSMTEQCERHVVVNSETHNLNDIADNIVKKLEQN